MKECELEQVSCNFSILISYYYMWHDLMQRIKICQDNAKMKFGNLASPQESDSVSVAFKLSSGRSNSCVFQTCSTVKVKPCITLLKSCGLFSFIIYL